MLHPRGLLGMPLALFTSEKRHGGSGPFGAPPSMLRYARDGGGPWGGVPGVPGRVFYGDVRLDAELEGYIRPGTPP